MTRQPHQNLCLHSITTRFCLYDDIKDGADIYITFCGFQYFILFVFKTIKYI